MNDQLLISILVFLTIVEMMFAMGLQMNFTMVRESIADAGALMIRGLAANYLLVPGAVLLMVVVLPVPPMVAAGLLILAATPGAPYGPPFAAIARGNLILATGLMVVLALSSAILAPLLLWIMLPWLEGAQMRITIDPLKLIITLFVLQLLPLFAGLALGQWKPALAARLVKPSTLLSKLLNILMMISVAVVQFSILSETSMSEIMLMLASVGVGLLIGWALGWPGLQSRKTLGMITGMRNMGLSMGIAVTSFAGTAAVTTVFAYTFVAGTALLVVAWGMRAVKN